MGQKNSKRANTSLNVKRRYSHDPKRASVYEVPQPVNRISAGNSSAYSRAAEALYTDLSILDEDQDGYNPNRYTHTMPKSLPHLNNEARVEKIDPPTLPKGGVTMRRQPTVFKDMDISKGRLQSPSILFYIDEKKKLLCVLDLKTRKWTKNQLLKAHFEHTNADLSLFGVCLFRNEVLSWLQNSILIPIDDQTIHVIGHYHLKYNIVKNCFYLQEGQNNRITNQTVCYGNKNIFCISGEQDGSYVTQCDQYDIKREVWVPMPNIPSPHVKGSAVCYLCPEFKDTFKVVVMGGLSSKIPTLFNYNISIFDFKQKEWETIPLMKMTTKPPKFYQAPLYQSNEGNLFIFGAESDSACYEINLEENKISVVEDLKNFKERGFAFQDRVSACTTEDNEFTLLVKNKQLMKRTKLEDGSSPRSPRKRQQNDYIEWKFCLTKNNEPNL